MTRILVVDSSPDPHTSVSRELTGKLVSGLTELSRESTVEHRDVGLNPLPHVDQPMIEAFYTPEENRTAEQVERLAESDAIVDEAFNADVIVIGSPMHNFSITSGLKSWIDHLARVGRTFSYTSDGPIGALGGRKVIVVTSRGGSYRPESPAASMDLQEPYLRTALGFVGIDDITFIHAEGVAGGSDGVDAARAGVEEYLSRHHAAAA